MKLRGRVRTRTKSRELCKNVLAIVFPTMKMGATDPAWKAELIGPKGVRFALLGSHKIEPRDGLAIENDRNAGPQLQTGPNDKAKLTGCYDAEAIGDRPYRFPFIVQERWELQCREALPIQVRRFEHGRDAELIGRSISDAAGRFHIYVAGKALAARVNSVDWLTSGILSVANASSLAAHVAVDKIIAAQEEALIAAPPD
jgi:hypothetical protein